MAANALRPHFPVGKRQISFPKFTIALVKSHLPPQFARFVVPMSFNKLDLRDYLFHVYNVRTLHIRSSITQGKASKNDKGQLRRDPPTKHMTAQLLEPFVWPAEPWVKQGVSEADWDGFQRGVLEATEEADQSGNITLQYAKRAKSEWEKRVPDRTERQLVKDQARRLLSGEQRWQSTAAAMGTEAFWKRSTGGSAGTEASR